MVRDGKTEINRELNPQGDLDEVGRWASLLTLPVELRVLDSKKGVLVGYYDSRDRLINDLLELSGSGPGDFYGKVEAVYTTLNPVAPAILARAYNRFKTHCKKGEGTTDREIARRVWLPLDVDADKPRGVSATDEEHQEALTKARLLRDDLVGRGFPAPVLADSGNGGHVLFKIDLPNTEDACRLLSRFLLALKARHAAGCPIDETVFNAARIWKAYGTRVAKGDEVGGRRHRLARLLEVPEHLEVVEARLIEAVATEAGVKAYSFPASPANSSLSASVCPDKDGMADFLARHGVEVVEDKEWPKAHGWRWLLARCPFCGNADRSAIVSVDGQGTPGFHCQHNSCKDKYHWPDFRKHLEQGQPGDDAVFDRQGVTPRGRQPVSQVLLALARDCELWHNPARQPFATVRVEGHAENHPVQSAAFKNWLTARYLGATGKAPSKAGLGEALATLEAQAAVRGRGYPIFQRIARTEGRLYVDLGDESWRVVEITGQGWRVTDSPVKFVRHDNLAALPLPAAPGDIARLRPFVNVSDGTFPLVVGSILDAFKGAGPYLVSIFTGERGSAKSTAATVIRSLVDPVKKAPLSSCPKDERDLGCDGHNNFVLAYDNISKLPAWLSDAFCRVSTGGGIKTRKLYSDTEQQIFDICRPLLLNGITDFATADDLLSRSVQIGLRAIPDTERRDEAQFWSEFEAAKPAVLAALFDALASGLRRLGHTELGRLPRMADSARWVAACFPALGWSYEDWLQPYLDSQATAVDVSLQSSLPAKALLAWWRRWQPGHGGEWVGTMTDLYDLIKAFAPDEEKKFFPTNPKSLSDSLRRVAPSLRAKGVSVQTGIMRRVDGKVKRVAAVSEVLTHEEGSCVNSASTLRQQGDPGREEPAPRPAPGPKSPEFGGKQGVGDAQRAAAVDAVDAALTHGNGVRQHLNPSSAKGLNGVLTHETQDSLFLGKKEKEEAENEETETRPVSCVSCVNCVNTADSTPEDRGEGVLGDEGGDDAGQFWTAEPFGPPLKFEQPWLEGLTPKQREALITLASTGGLPTDPGEEAQDEALVLGKTKRWSWAS